MKADKEFIRESVADIIGCEVSDIKDDTNFVKELEVNSIQMLEIVAAVEDEYDIKSRQATFQSMTRSTRSSAHSKRCKVLRIIIEELLSQVYPVRSRQRPRRGSPGSAIRTGKGQTR